MAKGAHCFEEVNERLYWFYAFYCWSSFHGTVAAVMAAHHRVWGFEKSDKISENPVFSRLLTFAPIITEESMRRTIPVAFMYISPFDLNRAISICKIERFILRCAGYGGIFSRRCGFYFLHRRKTRRKTKIANKMKKRHRRE
ncbi:MAG: hypothetical protein PUA86_07120 [Clostridiaceae bacterium]|nr:hypothetical protein [Clostridiaceae bacterium]